MFTELAPLLKNGDTLLITLAAEGDDKQRLTITQRPKDPPKEDSLVAAAYKPRVIIATPEELDRELPDALRQDVEVTVGVLASLKGAQSQLEQAKKDADAAVAAEQKRAREAKSAKPATPAAAKPEPQPEPALL